MKSRAHELFRWGHQMVFDGNRLGEFLVDYANAWKAEVGTSQPVEEPSGTEVREMLELAANSTRPETLAKILGHSWGPQAAEKALARITALESEVRALRGLVERQPIDPKCAEVVAAMKLVPSYKTAEECFLAGIRYAEMQHNVRGRRPL